MIVAPPSVGESGRYEIIRGCLDDLSSLPPLQNPALRRNAVRASEGHRNDALWRHCMQQAKYCDDLEALLDVARTANESCMPPLQDAEVVKLAESAWGYTERGENRFGQGQHVLASYGEIDGLLWEHPDAFTLLMILRRHHSVRSTFVIANAMAETMPGGWTRKRLSAARQGLEEAGMVVMIRPASLQYGPAAYRFGNGGR